MEVEEGLGVAQLSGRFVLVWSSTVSALGVYVGPVYPSLLTHRQLYIYIYICVCACVCVAVIRNRIFRENEFSYIVNRLHYSSN